MATRLDKYLCDNSALTRRMAKKSISKGEVRVNQQVVLNPATKINSQDLVNLNQQLIKASGYRYLMLYKPQGYICATLDQHYPSVLGLIKIEKAHTLRIAGRLDVDTTGLLLISDDGQWLHSVAAPRRHCLKTYAATLADPIHPDAILQCQQGIQLRGESQLTRSAQLQIITPYQVRLTISEGKYHQVKRMFAALGNKVLELHRQQIANLCLDTTMQPGEWRSLTPSEVKDIGTPKCNDNQPDQS